MSAKMYDEEFRENAVKLVKNRRSVLAVAKDLGIAEMTLWKWLASDKSEPFISAKLLA
jgi:transposase-like protein